MTAGDALLRSILARPEDDAPRLVYADWLEENGQGERAEFVRVQIRLASRDWTDNGHTNQALVRRAHGLVRRHKRKWLHPFQPQEPRESGYVGQRTQGPFGLGMHVVGLLGGQLASVDYVRGFVSVLSCEVQAFMGHAAEVFRAQPAIVQVRLTDCRPFPFTEEGRPTGRHGWHNDDFAWEDDGDLIPGELFDLLPPESIHPDEIGQASFSSADAAHAVLSPACVRLGRSLAGLPV
jgi:uncharacterized protein (TIGR02996 family)